MRVSKKTLLGAVGLLLVGTLLWSVYANHTEWLTGSTEEKFDTLAAIQPGLGTVMKEYGDRFSTMFYAAKAGNWELADYELHEALEIQEVGETTRPEKAELLKAFETANLDSLKAAIDSKDWDVFEERFNTTIQACNGCHAGTGHPYIKYTLPSSPPAPLQMEPGE